MVSDAVPFVTEAVPSSVVPSKNVTVPVGVGPDAHPGIRPIMTLTLSSDHRVVDGARAAEFMRDLVAAIRNPHQYFDDPGVGDSSV